jgi:hypothetical protein
MARKPFTKPVENSVAKVNDEVAVGEISSFSENGGCLRMPLGRS